MSVLTVSLTAGSTPMMWLVRRRSRSPGLDFVAACCTRTEVVKGETDPRPVTATAFRIF